MDREEAYTRLRAGWEVDPHLLELIEGDYDSPQRKRFIRGHQKPVDCSGLKELPTEALVLDPDPGEEPGKEAARKGEPNYWDSRGDWSGQRAREPGAQV